MTIVADSSKHTSNPRRGPLRWAMVLLLLILLVSGVFYRSIASELIYQIYLSPVATNEQQAILRERIENVSFMGAPAHEALGKLVLSKQHSFEIRNSVALRLNSGAIRSTQKPTFSALLNSVCDALAKRLEAKFRAEDLRLLWKFGFNDFYYKRASERTRFGLWHYLDTSLDPRVVKVDKSGLRIKFPFEPDARIFKALPHISGIKDNASGLGGGGASSWSGRRPVRQCSAKQRKAWLRAIICQANHLRVADFQSLILRIVKQKDFEMTEALTLFIARYEAKALSPQRMLYAMTELLRGDIKRLQSQPRFESLLIASVAEGDSNMLGQLLSYYETYQDLDLSSTGLDQLRSFIPKRGGRAKLALSLICFHGNPDYSLFMTATLACRDFAASPENRSRPRRLRGFFERTCSLKCGRHSAPLEFLEIKSLKQRLAIARELQSSYHLSDQSRPSNFRNLDWTFLRRCYLLAVVRKYDQIDNSVLEFLRRELRQTKSTTREQDLNDLLIAIVYCGVHVKRLKADLEHLAARLVDPKGRVKLQKILADL